jgi:Mn2+/Fe2+ NRAMP family transporter
MEMETMQRSLPGEYITHSKKKELRSKPFKKTTGGAILGAAFLMATSAIGPGFLTQTATFTETLLASFGFVILTSILLDIGAQLNIWRVLTVSELRAQDLSNKLLPGLGYALALLIVLGGLAFNIGNIAGCGLGLNVLTGMKTEYAAILSCVISLVIFWTKDAGKALDLFVKILGVVMILLTIYVAYSSHPPITEALKKSFVPDTISSKAIITLVGGTVGGYISFAGAHRLLDAGIKGKENLKEVNHSAVGGIIITGIMRTILFLAALGVVSQGVALDNANPASTVFLSAAGELGYKFFGIVMWSAAITSVVGASYTSISFIKTFHPAIEKNQRILISVFIIISTIVFVAIGKPKELLITAGFLNGFILPVALAIILVASTKTTIMKGLRNPVWLQATGWIVVGLLSWMAIRAIS